jgi:hypothetical protein
MVRPTAAAAAAATSSCAAVGAILDLPASHAACTRTPGVMKKTTSLNVRSEGRGLPCH